MLDAKALRLDSHPIMTNNTRHTRQSRPVSVRLTPEERAVLEHEAGSASLSQHIRARLFSGTLTPNSEERLSAASRQKLLAQILSRLGAMNAGKNLSDLADLARLGLLEMSPEAEDALLDASREFQGLRHDLVKALGLRPKNGGDQ